VDFVTLSSIMTVVAFATFVGIVLWAWSGRARRAFEEAAQLPFAEEEDAPETGHISR
jgi:cytochrome c oxidase cbb3-type subunit 4